MIDSFYFIALTMIDQSILIRGVSFTVDWSSQSLQMKPFTWGIFWQSNKQSHQNLDNDFGGLVEIKGNKIKSKLGSKSATSCELSSTLLLKIVALQLVTYLFLSHVCSKTKWGSFNKLRPFLRLLD